MSRLGPFIFILFFFMSLSSYASPRLNLTSFELGSLDKWEKEIFYGETDYNLVNQGDRFVLNAKSDMSASGLFLRQKIDLKTTPYLNWSWSVTRGLPMLDERKKSGDDHAARVYIVIQDGPFFWQTRSINYVWSGSQNTGEVWPNPFAKNNVVMLAVRGKDSSLNQWYSEKKNVYEDLIQYFGDKGSDEANMAAYRYIDAVAIMTDTDNSGASAESFYGDIIFSGE